MLNDLLSFLSGSPPPRQLPQADAHLALTALLVRVAKVDGHFDPAERATILSVLARQYGLDAAGAEALLGEAEELEARTGDHVGLTRLIKDTVPYEERRDVVEALWEVVLADGERHHEEAGFLRLVVSLIGVTDQESALARQRVMARS